MPGFTLEIRRIPEVPFKVTEAVYVDGSCLQIGGYYQVGFLAAGLALESPAAYFTGHRV